MSSFYEMRNLNIIILLIIAGSCTHEKATLDKKPKGKVIDVKWQCNDVLLTVRSIDAGFLGCSYVMSLQKDLPNQETIVYRLSSGPNDYYNHQIINDTLFLFDKYVDIGWRIYGSPTDTTITNINDYYKFHQGIYKLENNQLILFDKNPEVFFDLPNFDKGIYYISPKRCDLRYSLKDLAKQMNLIKNIKEAPSTLD
jgi:hypothetical protein